MWRGRYRMSEDGRPVAVWDPSWWRTGGDFEVDGRRFQVRANGWGTKSGGPGGQVFTGNWTNGCFRQDQRWATVGATAQACGFQ